MFLAHPPGIPVDSGGDHFLDPFLLLLQLTDSALPIGGYSHSWGLETAVQAGQLASEEEVFLYIQGLLSSSLGCLEGNLCGIAHHCAAQRNADRLAQWQAWLSANRWPKETRQASLQLGHRLLQLAEKVWRLEPPRPRQEVAGQPQEWHHCLVFGWIGGQVGIPLASTLHAYLFSQVVSLVSAAVRLVPLGHSQGQSIVIRLHHPLHALAEKILASRSPDGDPMDLLGFDLGFDLLTSDDRLDPFSRINSGLTFSAFAPLHERDCQQHQSLYSRLFQS
ncbi:MAG: urease accessory UreF family protein [Cyanobacteriota bacterium]|nr:urease accessory UreF family protein [Cyanobacteriota bacterium]